MRSHKIYLGVPTDGTKPPEYARTLSHHIHVVFQMAYGRKRKVNEEQLAAMLAINRLQDELYRIAFPRRRGKK